MILKSSPDFIEAKNHAAFRSAAGSANQVRKEANVSDRLSPSMLRSLQAVACLIIIMWAIRGASHLLVILLLALMLAYAFVAVPQWLMRRFQLGKALALTLTLTLTFTLASFGTLNVITVTLLYESVARMTVRMPVYHERFMSLFEKLIAFATTHGMHSASLSTAKLSTSDQILDVGRVILRQGGASWAIVFSFLCWRGFFYSR